MYLMAGWERSHHAVDIGDLAITTESNDLPLANIHLGLRKGKVGGAIMLAIVTHHPGTVLTYEAVMSETR